MKCFVSTSRDVPVSTLETQVQDLIKLICDISTMEQSVVEMEYDTKKAPLGKITTEQVYSYSLLLDLNLSDSEVWGGLKNM